MTHAQPNILSGFPSPLDLGAQYADALSGVPWRQRYQMALRATDAVIVLAAVLGAGHWTLSQPSFAAGGLEEPWVVGLAVTAGWLLMMTMFRTRDSRIIGEGALEYKRVTQASGTAFGWLAVIIVLVGSDSYRGFMVLAFPAGLLGLLGSRWMWRHWLVRQREFGHFLSKVVVVGKNTDVQYVVTQLSRKSGAVYEVVGAVLEGKAGSGRFQIGNRSVPAVSGLRRVEETVAATGADAVIVAGHLKKGGTFIRELGWRLERTSTELVLASALTNVAGPRIQLRPVEGLPLMHVELPQFTGGRHIVKRTMDIVVSLAALIVLAPVFAFLALLIRSDSGGPVWFSQDRVGRQAARFKMYKFRSMVVTAEDELARLKALNEGRGLLFKLRDDPRVTRVGRWMRKHSLDELPQFYNVLKGDMSLVGPRPPLPDEVLKYEESTRRRLLIKPGLTGLWQINGRSDLEWGESIRLDLYYVENWSVTGDLMIMWRTFKVILKPVGAY